MADPLGSDLDIVYPHDTPLTESLYMIGNAVTPTTSMSKYKGQASDGLSVHQLQVRHSDMDGGKYRVHNAELVRTTFAAADVAEFYDKVYFSVIARKRNIAPTLLAEFAAGLFNFVTGIASTTEANLIAMMQDKS